MSARLCYRGGPKRGKESYEQRKGEANTKARKAVDESEAELADVESQIAELDARMATNYSDEDSKLYGELKLRYESLMCKWRDLG